MKSTLQLLFASLLFAGPLNAQSPVWRGAQATGTNYYEICRKADSAFSRQRAVVSAADEFRFKDGEFEEYQRWKWYWRTRVDEQGNFPDITFTSTSERNVSASQRTQSMASWTCISQTVADGGYNGMGRATCIAFDPQSLQTIYVGAPIGGLWKSTDGGQTYTPLTDGLPYVSVGSCVVDYSNGNTLYISVGDHWGWWNFSMGVYKSTDGGATWNATGLNWNLSQGRAISKILQDPFNAQILYAATSNGLYKTTNGGTNWTVVRSGYYSDIEFEPGSSNLYAALHDYWGISQVFRTTDGGSSWTQLTSFTDNYNWIRLAVTPAAPAKLAVVCSIGNHPLYVSNNYGSGLTYVSDVPDAATLYISPVNANVFYSGFVYVDRSTDGGVTWNHVTWWYNNPPYPTVHADQRFVLHHPQQPDWIYFCNDGGLYRYAESTSTWTELVNGLVITQFYKIANSQTDASLVLGGTQDNGGRIRNTNGTWRATNGGDAMEVQIDPTNNNVIYTTYIYGKLYRSLDQWTNDTYHCISDNIPGGTPPGDWVAPYVIDPSDNNTIVAGYDDVWRSTDRGDNWTALSSNLFWGNRIQCLAVAPSDASTIWVSSGNDLFKTNDLGQTWDSIIVPGSAEITSITLSPDNINEVWMTRGGYTSTSKVYYSNNAGQTWQNWSSGLPNVTVNTSLYEIGSNDVIFIGTDAGVYTRDSLSGSWSLVGTGLPNTSVTDLEIYYPTGLLRAGTYGRGIWETVLPIPTGTGTSVPSVSGLLVLPNPAQGESQLQISLEKEQMLTIEVVNVLGQCVWTSTVTGAEGSQRFTMPSFTAGQYVVRVSGEFGVSHTSFVVK